MFTWSTPAATGSDHSASRAAPGTPVASQILTRHPCWWAGNSPTPLQLNWFVQLSHLVCKGRQQADLFGAASGSDHHGEQGRRRGRLALADVFVSPCLVQCVDPSVACSGVDHERYEWLGAGG